MNNVWSIKDESGIPYYARHAGMDHVMVYGDLYPATLCSMRECLLDYYDFFLHNVRVLVSGAGASSGRFADRLFEPTEVLRYVPTPYPGILDCTKLDPPGSRSTAVAFVGSVSTRLRSYFAQLEPMPRVDLRLGYPVGTGWGGRGRGTPGLSLQVLGGQVSHPPGRLSALLTYPRSEVTQEFDEAPGCRACWRLDW